MRQPFSTPKGPPPMQQDAVCAAEFQKRDLPSQKSKHTARKTYSFWGGLGKKINCLKSSTENSWVKIKLLLRHLGCTALVSKCFIRPSYKRKILPTVYYMHICISSNANTALTPQGTPS